jgi:hypothetical protein
VKKNGTRTFGGLDGFKRIKRRIGLSNTFKSKPIRITGIFIHRIKHVTLFERFLADQATLTLMLIRAKPVPRQRDPFPPPKVRVPSFIEEP